MALPTPPLPGDQVGPYVLGEAVGVGGMATVYKAESPTLGRVALKILHPGKATSDEAKRFKREFEALKKLRHPGVVRVFDSGARGDYPWISMEYVDGHDLGTIVEDEWVKSPPEDRWERVEKILRLLSDALAYVHSKGQIHRDIKPSNVLLTPDGRPKLTDFGVVKAPGSFSTELTAAGRLVGTVAFMAPEQITGDPIDARVDLYSLGAVLYVMLTGRRPIQADSIAGYLARHLTETPRPPSELDPGVPQRLERICLKLLRKDPGQRYNSARQLVEELDEKEGLRKSHLQGRDTEVEEIMRRVHRLAQGEGGLLVVVGDRGIGKSAIVQDVVDRAKINHLRVATTAGTDPNPLGILCEQMPSLDPNDATASRAQDQLFAMDTKPLPPAAAGIAARAKHDPWLLVIDDADRLKAPDVDALGQLVRVKLVDEARPLLFLLTAPQRKGVVDALVEFVGPTIASVITLEPLDRRATIAVVRDLGVTGGSGAVLGRRLHEDLAGNPGAVREQVEAMVRAGWLTQAPDGSLQLTKTVEEVRDAQLPVPDRVLTKEEARLAHLSPVPRRLLDVLALLGMEAPLDLCCEVAEIPPAELAVASRQLVDQGLVKSKVEGTEEIIGFRVPRYRELVYRLMDADRRVAFHRAAANTLLRLTNRRTGSVTEIVASHLLRGGEVVAAYPMLLQAARWSLRNGQFEDALNLVKQAHEVRLKAELAIDREEAVRNRRLAFSIQGEVLEARGDLPQALIAWESALKAAREEGNEAAVARAVAGIGLVRAARGEPEEAVEHLDLAMATLAQGDPAWQRVAEALATSRLMKGEVDGAQHLWTELLAVGRETSNTRAVAMAHVGLGLVAVARGRVKDRWDHLAQAQRELGDSGTADIVAMIETQMADIALVDGRLKLAIERAENAENVAREAGLVHETVRAMGVASQAMANMGDQGQALSIARDAAGLFRATETPSSLADVLAIAPLVRALCSLRREDDCRPLLPAALPPGGRGLEDPAGQLLGLRARVQARNDPARAVEAAQKALERPPAALPPVTARIRLDAANALLGTHPKAALAAAEGVVAFLRGRVFRMLVVEAHWIAAKAGGDRSHKEALQQIVHALEKEVVRPGEFRQRWLL